MTLHKSLLWIWEVNGRRKKKLYCYFSSKNLYSIHVARSIKMELRRKVPYWEDTDVWKCIASFPESHVIERETGKMDVSFVVERKKKKIATIPLTPDNIHLIKEIVSEIS